MRRYGINKAAAYYMSYLCYGKFPDSIIHEIVAILVMLIMSSYVLPPAGRHHYWNIAHTL